MSTPDLRERITLIMDLAQMKRERDYLLAERTRLLRDVTDYSSVLYELLEEPGLPPRLDEKIRDLLGC